MQHKKMRLLLAVLLALTILSTSAFSQDKAWREIRAPHFRVLTNGTEGCGRHVVREFERMRAVFASQFPGYRLDSAEPVLILAPENEYSAEKLLPVFWQHSGPKPAGVYFHSWKSRMRSYGWTPWVAAITSETTLLSCITNMCTLSCT